MATEDPRVTCPYDKSHQISKSRMQVHLVRCEKNHSRQDKETCPYNTLHIIDKIQFKNHVLNCPDAKEVQSFQFNCDDKEIPGIISMDEIRAHQANAGNQDGSENWENDFHPTYDPLKSIAEKPIIRGLICESKAKKREFRMKERQRMAQFANDPVPSKVVETQVEKTNPLEPLRPPRVKSADAPKPLRPPRTVGADSSESKNLQKVESKTKNNDASKTETKSEASSTSSKNQDKVKIPKRKPVLSKEPTEALKNNNIRSVASSIKSNISTDVVSIEKKMKDSEITEKPLNTEKKKMEESLEKGLLDPSQIQDNKNNNNYDFVDQSVKIKRAESNFTTILSTVPSSPASSINSDRPSIGSGKGRGIFADFVPQPLNVLKARGKLSAIKLSNEAQTSIDYSDFEDY